MVGLKPSAVTWCVLTKGLSRNLQESGNITDMVVSTGVGVPFLQLRLHWFIDNEIEHDQWNFRSQRKIEPILVE